MGNAHAKPSDFDGQVNLSHFRLLRVVGRGAFGKVRIVERKDTGLSFALKYIRKDEVVRSESVRNIIRERRMLENMSHPFLCNLRYSFQDIEYMYLVVDLMSGGDLRFHITRKTFTEEAVRFWIAELGCALRYVHSQNIIHRDIKPDNVLLDADGHVHLTDFNVASDISRSRPLTSKSGTLAYLAPEVYSGKGYDVRADWWSLGVLFYECIYNKRPFEGYSEASLGEQVQAGKPRYPITKPPVSPDCMYAIAAALELDRDKRLGHTWESFTDHDFFRVLDFDLLLQKKIEPVFVPSSDKTNFDATYDLEELLLEEAPLEARARRQKPRERLKEDASQQEIRADELYRMIETDFKPYDYTHAAYKKLTKGAAAAATAHDDSTSKEPSRQPPQTPQTQHEPQNPPQSQSPPQQQQQPHEPRDPQEPSPYDRLPTTLTTDEAVSATQITPRPSMQAPRPSPRLPDVPPPPVPQLAHTHSSAPSTTTATHGKRAHGSATRHTSTTTGGGYQMTLDVTGSWSHLARQDATLPADAGSAAGAKGHAGVFGGFWGRKKGRAGPAKPKERGVLGKEGARVVIG